MLILSFSDISSDARVLKQVKEFSKDFEVTTCGYGPHPKGAHKHIEVSSDYPIWAYPKADVLLRRFKRAYWGNDAVKHAQEKLAGKKFDVVLADEIDAVPLALSLAPRFSVYAALHEYSPKVK